ncbi:TRAP transporter small permease [Paenochrobactrum glaciei]|uniref:TRAP transporter small permease protein n=1 Tax=Paenochrobactrum glaciei TaxID=486407 RepID=A0ABP3RTL6_9HYPH
MKTLTTRPQIVLWRLGKTVFVGLGTFCIIALILLIFSDVLSRNIFNKPIPGVMEMTEHWLMVPMTFVGIWWAALKNEHVRVTILTEVLGSKSRLIAEVVVGCCAAFFLLQMSWIGLGVAIESYQDGEYAGAFKIITWPVRFVAVIGFLSFACVIALRLYTILKAGGAEELSSDTTEAAND